MLRTAKDGFFYSTTSGEAYQGLNGGVGFDTRAEAFVNAIWVEGLEAGDTFQTAFCTHQHLKLSKFFGINEVDFLLEHLEDRAEEHVGEDGGDPVFDISDAQGRHLHRVITSAIDMWLEANGLDFTSYYFESCAMTEEHVTPDLDAWDERTRPAYSRVFFNDDQWHLCVLELLGRGYTDRQAEAILCSKIMRHCRDRYADDSSVGRVEHLIKYFDNALDDTSISRVDRMVKEMEL